MILLIQEVPGVLKLTAIGRREVEWWLSGAGGREAAELLFNGYKIVPV